MKTVSIQQLATDSGVVFGTSGARGLVEQLTPEVCAGYTAAFLNLFERASVQQVVVGIDLRSSSPEIARACILAIESAGLVAEFCGVVPTPALALHAMQKGVPAIMVTGSHIPFDRNGIKFYRPEGEITKADEAAIMGAEVLLPEPLELPDLPTVNEGAQQRYLERYLQFLPKDMLAGLRVGFYQHSSVARDLLTTLLSRLGAEVIALGRTDKFVPIDTEAVSEEDAERAKAWVLEHQLDALISTDGDADRPLLGDEQGIWFRGDVVGLLCARFLKAEALVTPVSCTTAIEKSGWFKHITRTRIGSPYVIEGMEALQAAGKAPVVGFEANGGFLLGSEIEHNGKILQPLPTRDAVLPILALLALAHEKGMPLSALTTDLPKRFTASDRLQGVAIERSRKLLMELEKDSEPLARLYGPVLALDVTDGLRFTFESGDIVHLRPSGNAPELRCYAEAEDAVRAEELVAEVLELARCQ
ncbi:MAG: phosphomannomutase [Gammaproteobacteria bacterium (ex Lamellibrachia satsuma)]|nr:MAG: phosphomannomutase [Gammaproteobacteria bacterium (ex Lamellibrachia satsuma)]RRS35454.1 MAG: phosphomannomutase [Gammaproteobacteria bacterium (ex Lamellibrachia satsuma)]RRS37054.1 MAG: phosphomannomutase [Gammaproteobacteria bacterium (ex Lamellibrachia satsuma)]